MFSSYRNKAMTRVDLNTKEWATVRPKTNPTLVMKARLAQGGVVVLEDTNGEFRTMDIGIFDRLYTKA